jgi:putative PIN family toxin of toxin-antitoxin system
MRVVLDTNLLVSGLLKPDGNERRVLRLGLSATRITVMLSPAIIREYETVLPRARLKLTASEVAQTLNALRAAAESVEPDFTLHVTKVEPDNRFLECAVAGQAAYVVTGNARHFPRHYKGIQVVQARRLFEQLAPMGESG